MGVSVALRRLRPSPATPRSSALDVPVIVSLKLEHIRSTSTRIREFCSAAVGKRYKDDTANDQEVT